MQIKVLEIRDRGTFLPMFAFTTGCTGDTGRDYLLRRSGYSVDSDLVMFGYLGMSHVPACYDPYDWNDRTKKVAHEYIQKHWHELKDGDVVDVEFILGETKQPKTSERNEVYV